MLTYDADYFDINATLRCGQAFRYRPAADGYEVFAGHSKAFARTAGGVTTVETDDEPFFVRYFDTETDYAAIVRAAGAFPEAAAAAEAGRGIRILRQPLFEAIVESVVSANNNIPRIRAILDRLCERYGAPMNGYYAFPEPERLKDVTAADFRALGAGYRDEYLRSAVRAALETDLLTALPGLDTVAAGERLCALPGIGRKVADCVLLFGLHRGDVFPTDTWIFKAYRSETLTTPDKVRRHCIARYGDIAGYVQQYIFYDHIRENGR